MSNGKNKSVVTKESLIGIIADKCEDDFISVSDLIKLIDKSVDEHGSISKKKLIKAVKGYHTKTVIKDVYNIECDIDKDPISNKPRIHPIKTIKIA